MSAPEFGYGVLEPFVLMIDWGYRNPLAATIIVVLTVALVLILTSGRESL